jgi:hypothetical protein
VIRAEWIQIKTFMICNFMEAEKMPNKQAKPIQASGGANPNMAMAWIVPMMMMMMMIAVIMIRVEWIQIKNLFDLRCSKERDCPIDERLTKLPKNGFL